LESTKHNALLVKGIMVDEILQATPTFEDDLFLMGILGHANSGTAQVANQMAERGINIVSEESTTLRIANCAYFNQSYIIDPQIKQSRRERRAEQRRLKSCIKDN
jgi:hypothetical protein